MLKDKVVVVTGGASGFGKAASIEFAKLGAKVVVSDINDPQAVVDHISALGGLIKTMSLSKATELHFYSQLRLTFVLLPRVLVLLGLTR